MPGLGNDSECCQKMPYKESQTLLAVIYYIVIIIGLPTNIITMCLTIVLILKENILAVYLFGLSLSEVMYLCTLPLWIIYVQNGHIWEMGPLACKITGYIFFCNVYISILLLCCISVDRYVGVVYSLESKGVRGQKIAGLITFILFSVVLVVHIPVFVLPDNENCTTCFETLPLNLTFASFGFARFLIGFAIPCIILIFTNYKIFQIIKISCSLNEPQKTKAKHLAAAAIAIFLICFAPYHLVLLIRAIYFFLYQNDTCSFERGIYSTSAIFLCFSTANSIADPIIYVLASKNSRDFSRSLSLRVQSSLSSRSDSTKLKNSKESQEPVQTSEI
ncbi:putative G-protein coupled receptor 132 [Pelodiscus sinensis]|uniref:putative G-protein coupled receptor 132 n=1 Tax=Pelodiscus sinensis TaxID=13735 RepID=UPI003F6C8BA3